MKEGVTIKYQAGQSTTSQIDAIRDWLNHEVCPLFSFRIPDNEDLNNVREAPPKAHSRYFPMKDNLPKIITEETLLDYTAPSVVVMPKSVSRGYRMATLGAHMLFTVWHPGENGKFDHEGWRSITNMLDATARLLAKQVTIGVLTLELDEGNKTIDYGLVNDEEATPDLRPYYMGYLTASFSYPIRPVQTYGEEQSPTAVWPVNAGTSEKTRKLLE